MSRWVDYLIRLAVQKLMGVIGVVTQQCDRMQHEIVDEVVRAITGPMDDYWHSDSADKFREELTQAVNELTEAIGLTASTCQGLDEAKEVMIRADQQAKGLVSDLNQVYSKIIQ